MKLLFFCPHWGSDALSWNEFFTKVKKDGYNGVEMSLPLDNPSLKKELVSMMKDFGFQYIAQHWETVEIDFEKHKVEYEKRLLNLADAQPLFINSQTGKDYYTFDQNVALFDIAKKVTKKTGIKVIHETHRGKWSFAAHITKQYLEKLPDLELGLDLSHWCNTAETYLQDQKEAVNLAIQHAAHIHARVGYPEGPQVPDPRDERWKEALDHHLSWWDKVLEINSKKGKAHFTITPEFGAPPYMVILPHTRIPITNQWEVNTYMMNLLKGRY
jgi:sugar phosphate isomerase/epimerase